MYSTCFWVSGKIGRYTHGADQNNSFEVARLSVENQIVLSQVYGSKAVISWMSLTNQNSL